jgi:hypothetical protein
MKKHRKDLKKACLLSIIIALSLLTIMGSPYNLSVYALKRYGYEKGDEYRFVMEMSTTTDTEEGKATASQSYEMIIKITDVDEDVDSYSIKIDYLLVGSTGYYPGFYDDGLMTEGSMEGDGLLAGGSFPTGGMFNLFTSTDWSDREDEWNDYVDEIDDQTGYKVTEDSVSNGVFTLKSEMDVSDDESNIDYDDDGDYDDYTGWLSVRGEYDSNGVLKSSTAEYYMEFNSENSVTYSSKVYSGARAVSSDMLIYTAIGVASFVVAFILGFFVGKGRMPKATGIPATKPTATGPEVPAKQAKFKHVASKKKLKIRLSHRMTEIKL